MEEINRNMYVVVTDYVQPNTGEDVSDALQELIFANPNRTIFFPDGEYLLSKPICTPANPVNAVSLKLATFAKLKAMDSWTEKEAVVRMGAAEPYNSIYIPGSNYYFEGGIIDGNGKANGISVDSGRETAIHHVSIKNTEIGIHIKWGANNRSSDSDIFNVNIVGNHSKTSIGVFLEGHDNTLTNMRIAGVHVGIQAETYYVICTRFIPTVAKTPRTRTSLQALRLWIDGMITITISATAISSVQHFLCSRAHATSIQTPSLCGIAVAVVLRPLLR